MTELLKNSSNVSPADRFDLLQSVAEEAEETNQLSGLSKYEHLRITDSTPIPPPVAVISINGETISTKCNLTTLSGASKSGKSALSSIMLAGAISRTGLYDGLDGLHIQPNVEGKAVVHIDTEQARHKHQLNVKTILKRCSMESCPDYFLSYNIRELDIETYEIVTNDICDSASEHFKGVHLIVIDGIADFITHVNDPIQANAIVKFFEDLAIKFSCPIVTIVHTNPGSGKERGHLGSQIQRKSESVIEIKNENDISFIEPKFLRMAGKGNVPSLQFIYDKEKGYHVSNGVKPTDEDQKRIKHQTTLNQICLQVFTPGTALKYGEAVKAIQEATGKSQAPCKQYLVDLQTANRVYKDVDQRYKLV